MHRREFPKYGIPQIQYRINTEARYVIFRYPPKDECIASSRDGSGSPVAKMTAILRDPKSKGGKYF